MRIGIIGLGVVGGAVRHGLERIRHEVKGYDLRQPETRLSDVLDTELAFVCVPTPCRPDGSCDISAVELTVNRLDEAAYKGLVVIKSTVTPGTTERFSASHPRLRFAFCPEFLRERCAKEDFCDNHEVCVIGAADAADFELVKLAHGPLPQSFAHVTPTEAELAKYFSNVYNALRIIFANEFYEVSRALGADYSRIKEAVSRRASINDSYLDCHDAARGFGGVCLPKDTYAFAALARRVAPDMKLFDLIVEENKKFKTTVPDGMREAFTV